MYRHTFAAKIRSGKKDAFRKVLGKIWNDAVLLLDGIHAKNFSLWEADDLVFGYYETEQELMLWPMRR